MSNNNNNKKSVREEQNKNYGSLKKFQGYL